MASQNEASGQAYYYMALLDEKRSNYITMRQNLRRALDLNPGLTAARLKLGVVDVLLNEYGQAMEEVKTVLLDHPNNLDAQMLKASIHIRQKDYETALEILKDVQTVDPDNIDALSLRAGLYSKDGRFDQALALVNSGLKLDPANASLRFIRIKINAERNNSAAMIEDYQDLVAYYPDNDDYKLKLAIIDSMTGKLQDAEALLLGVVRKYPDKLAPKLALLDFLHAKSKDRAPEEYERFMHSEELAADAMLEMTRWMLANDYQEVAVKGLQQIVQSNGNEPAGLLAQTLLGEVELGKKNYDKASAILDKVLQTDSAFLPAGLLKARLLISQNQVDAAIALLSLLVWSHDESGDTYQLLGQAYQAKNDGKQALSSFKQALEVNPANLEAFFPVYDSYLQKNQQKFARMMLDKALKLKPNHDMLLGVKVALDIEEKNWDEAETTLQRFAMFSRDKVAPAFFQASILQGRGSYAKAIDLYEKLLVERPDDYKILANLARCHEGLQDRDKAIDFLRKLHEQYPNNLSAVAVLDELYFADHDLASARQLITAQLVRTPKVPSLYIELARIEMVSGKSPQIARQIYLQGLQANPHDIRLELALAGWFQQTGDQADAIKTYQQLLDHHPESEVAANNLARLLLDSPDQNDFAKGMELAEKFRDSDNPAYQDTYAWSLLRAGNVEAGLKLLESLGNKDPNLVEIKYHLAIAHFNNGNKATAQAELRQTLAMAERQHLNFSGKDDARKLLKELETYGK